MKMKKLCRRMFEDYLNDCGLDSCWWDCIGAAELMVCWLATHDYEVSCRFADWPIGVRTRIVSSTTLCVRWCAPIEKSEGGR